VQADLLEDEKMKKIMDDLRKKTILGDEKALPPGTHLKIWKT